MIHPRPGPIGLNSINTIETMVHTPTVMERVLVTAPGVLDRLSPHLRIRDESKNQDSKKRNRSQKMILRSGPNSSMMNNVTNIRGDNKQMLNPGAYRIKTSVNFANSSPVGSIGNAPKARENITRMLQHVSEGRNIDLLA